MNVVVVWLCSRVIVPQRAGVSYEICAVDIVGTGQKIRLICVYRPPRYTVEQTRGFFEILAELIKDSYSFVICGDFNLPKMTWSPPVPHDSLAEILHDFLMTHGLCQFINEPTHRAGNTLDLVIGSDEYVVHNCAVTEPVLADHFNICFRLNCGVVFLSKRKTIYMYDKCSGLSSFLSDMNWHWAFEGCQLPEDFWDRFRAVLQFGIENFIPTKILKCNK
jgi:hypothetical protein